MQCNFRVGMKVTPIKIEISDYERGQHAEAKKRGVVFPQHGSVYTIRDCYNAVRSDGVEIAVVRLVEIKNDPAMKFANGKVGEIGFDARCFRPVVDRGTEKGMSILREILTKTGKPVEEVA
ncbi:hypothetical protein [Shinella zoogloeoides]